MCVSVCPKNAVKMHISCAGFLVAKVDYAICVNCGACLKCCPSAQNEKICIGDFNEEKQSMLAVYIGHACNQRIRENAQSGGVTTALNKYLLDHELVQANAMVGFADKNQMSVPVFVETGEELLKHQGSYYYQTPMCQVVTSARDISVTLLSCQAQAISLYEEKHKTNIKYKLGLICTGQYSCLQKDQMLRKSGIKNPVDIRFKDKRY